MYSYILPAASPGTCSHTSDAEEAASDSLMQSVAAGLVRSVSHSAEYTGPRQGRGGHENNGAQQYEKNHQH